MSKVEVTSTGSLARVIMDRKVRYSASEVAAISQALEEKLDVVPAVRPGLPPEEPTRTKKTFDKIFSISDSTIVLFYLGVVFAISLVFPAKTSEIMLSVAYLYQLLSEALVRAF